MRLLVEQAPDAIIVLDLDTNRIVEANPSAEKLFGYSQDELLKHDLREFYTPSQPDELPIAQSFREHETRAAADETLAFERAVRNGQGQEFICEVRLNRLPLAGRNLLRASLVDISERKRAEDASRRASIYARNLIEVSLDPLFTISPEGKIADVNQTTVIVTGVPRDKLIGSDFSQYFTEPEKARAGFREVFTKGSIRDYSLVIRHVSGDFTEVIYNACLYSDEKGVVFGMFAAARDITELKAAEKHLAEMESKYRGLLEAAPDAMVVVNTGGDIILLNVQAERQFGYRRNELLGRNVKNIISEGFAERLVADSLRTVAEALAQQIGEGIELTARRKDGSEFPIELMLSPLESAEGVLVTAAIRDISKRKAAEELLRRAERALKALGRGGNALVRATDERQLLKEMCGVIVETGGYVMASIGFAEHDEAKTVRPVEWAGDEAGYLEKAQISWADTERGQGPTGTAIRTGKPQVNRNFATNPQLALLRAEALERGYASSLALPLKVDSGIFGALTIYASEPDAFDGDELRLLIELADDLSYGINALRAEKELCKHRDHLEELVAERTAGLAAANAKLDMANKELETFAYSVSHDLRAPLRAVEGFSRILLEDYADKLDAEGQRVLNVVRDSTVKMDQMISDILAFSRVGRTDMATASIDMEGLVRATIKDLETVTAGRKVSFEVGALPQARGDAAMMQRVWANLLENAVKYTGPKPEARIEIGATAGQGETVYFVRDNGIGFDMKYVDRLFGVFQRLHGAEFGGTGIGLAIVKRIVTRHGGRVWAEGKPSEGATFYFALPTSIN